MRRPFLLVGISYLVFSILANCCSEKIKVPIMLCFLGLFFVSVLIKKICNNLPLIVVAFLAALAFIISFFANKNIVVPIEKLNGKSATITATLCELPYKSFNKHYYIVKTDKIEVSEADQVFQNMKIKISCSKGLDLDVYDRLKCKVTFYTKDDDGIFSSKKYYQSKGIHLFAYMHEYENYEEIPGKEKPIYYYFLKLKKEMISALRRIITDSNSGIAQGILLGEKYSIDEEIRNTFKDVGISHLLSVSGLHISIVMTFLIAIFRFFRLSKKLVYIFSAVGVLSFAAITGFTASVTRASIMCIIYLLGKAFFKRADSLNSLGFATFFMCIANPFCAGDIGFILSVCSTLGIIILEPKLECFLKKNLEKVSSKILKNVAIYFLPLFCVTLSATISTLPITILYFKKISLVGVISNILIVAPSTLMFIFILLSAVFYLISPLRFLAMLCGIFANYFLSYITFCANLLVKLPFASISTDRPYMTFWLASVVLLLAFILILAKNNYEKYTKMCTLLSGTLLFCGILSYKLFNFGITSLAIVDVGDGLSLVLIRGNRNCVIACGGDQFRENKLINYLDSKNIKNLDCLILDSFQENNSNYARKILESYSPYVTILPYLDDIDDNISKFIYNFSNTCFYNFSSKIKLWGNVTIEPHCSKDYSYTVLKINEIKILICTNCENSGLVPPSESIDSAVLVKSNGFENIKNFSSRYVVMSVSLENCKKEYLNIAKNGKIPLATANGGNLIFDFLGKNKVVVRRGK